MNCVGDWLHSAGSPASAHLPQVGDVERGGTVHALSPGLVAGKPDQPGVELKTRGLESSFGCCDHLQQEKTDRLCATWSGNGPFLILFKFILLWCECVWKQRCLVNKKHTVFIYYKEFWLCSFIVCYVRKRWITNSYNCWHRSILILYRRYF